MKLTSSQFASAIGISPWCSRQKLFRQLTGIENREPVNDRMQWGIENECNAIAAVEAETGILFLDTGDRQRHYTINGGEHEYGTTPDGRSGTTGCEVKCPGNLWSEPPPHYIPQLIGQAHIAKLEMVIFAGWTPDDLNIWKYTYDPEHWNWLHPLLEGFMADWAEGTEPKRQKKPTLPDIHLEQIV